MTRIPLDEVKHGALYRIRSRNLTFGVFNKELKGYVGIREKFGERYLSYEDDWETGPPHGTAVPLEYICDCPIEDLSEGHSDEKYFRMNQPLFDWLKEKEAKGD